MFPNKHLNRKNVKDPTISITVWLQEFSFSTPDILPYQNPQQMVRWSDVMARICPQFHPRPPASPCPWEFTVFSVTFWGRIPFRFPCFFPWKLLFSVYSHIFTIYSHIFTIYSHILPINFHNIFPWMGPSHLVFFFSSQGILLRVKVVQLRGKSSWSLWTRWRPGTQTRGPGCFDWKLSRLVFGGSRSLLGVPGVSWGFQESPGGSRSLLGVPDISGSLTGNAPEVCYQNPIGSRMNSQPSLKIRGERSWFQEGYWF